MSKIAATDQADQPATTDRRNTVRERSSLEQADDHPFYDMEGDEQHREDERFVHDRIDQRSFVQPAAQIRILGYQHHLRQDERIDDGKSVPRLSALGRRCTDWLARKPLNVALPTVRTNALCGGELPHPSRHSKANFLEVRTGRPDLSHQLPGTSTGSSFTLSATHCRWRLPIRPTRRIFTGTSPTMRALDAPAEAAAVD